MSTCLTNYLLANDQPLISHLLINDLVRLIGLELANGITNQSSSCFMTSLDVHSLFTNVFFDETIKICFDDLFTSETSFQPQQKGNVRIAFINFKRICHFVDNKYYSQTYGVAMVSYFVVAVVVVVVVVVAVFVMKVVG